MRNHAKSNYYSREVLPSARRTRELAKRHLAHACSGGSICPGMPDDRRSWGDVHRAPPKSKLDNSAELTSAPLDGSKLPLESCQRYLN